jgi:hypothetical protein
MKEHGNQQAAFIHADAAIYGGRLNAGSSITQPIKHQAYVLISKGEVVMGDKRMKQGDGAEVTSSTSVGIHAKTDSEIILIDVPHSNHD